MLVRVVRRTTELSQAQAAWATLRIIDYPSAPKGAAEGEDDLGAYLRIYGWNFGTFADYMSGANSVTIGGQAIANYRYLQPAVGGVGNDPWPDVPVCRLARFPVLLMDSRSRLRDSRRSRAANPQDILQILDADGNPITFTPNPGPIYFFCDHGQ